MKILTAADDNRILESVLKENALESTELPVAGAFAVLSPSGKMLILDNGRPSIWHPQTGQRQLLLDGAPNGWDSASVIASPEAVSFCLQERGVGQEPGPPRELVALAVGDSAVVWDVDNGRQIGKASGRAARTASAVRLGGRETT